MVHFNFIVEDVDAENIFFSIRNDALRNDERIMDLMARKDISDDYRTAMIAACERSRDYTLSLLELMKNTRAKE